MDFTAFLGRRCHGAVCTVLGPFIIIVFLEQQLECRQNPEGDKQASERTRFVFFCFFLHCQEAYRCNSSNVSDFTPIKSKASPMLVCRQHHARIHKHSEMVAHSQTSAPRTRSPNSGNLGYRALKWVIKRAREFIWDAILIACPTVACFWASHDRMRQSHDKTTRVVLTFECASSSMPSWNVASWISNEQSWVHPT